MLRNENKSEHKSQLKHFSFNSVLFLFNVLYLKMKINSLIKRLIEMKRRKRFIRIRETLQSLNDYITVLK